MAAAVHYKFTHTQPLYEAQASKHADQRCENVYIYSKSKIIKEK